MGGGGSKSLYKFYYIAIIILKLISNLNINLVKLLLLLNYVIFVTILLLLGYLIIVTIFIIILSITLICYI